MHMGKYTRIQSNTYLMALNKVQNLMIFQIPKIQSKVTHNTQNHEDLDL